MDQDILYQIEDLKKQLQEQACPNEFLQVIVQLRKLTSKEQNPPLQEIIHSDVCKQLVAIMDNTTSSDILMETLWILTNVCSGNASQTEYIIEIGGVSQFLKYVGHENEDVMAQALWGLGNIAGDCSSNRDLVLNQGAVTIVLKQLERKNLKISNQRTIVWVISNFCRGKPLPKYDVVRPCMFYLGKSIENFEGDSEIISDSLWGLNYLSEADHAIEDLINYGILQKICNKYIHSKIHNILTPAMRIIGNVATSKDSYVDFLLQQNIIQPLIALFVHEKKAYRKESLWTISNIMAGTQQQVQKILDQPSFFENLISNKNQSLDVKKEMYFVITNSLNIDNACKFFLDHNILPLYLEDITVHDIKIQGVIIEGLELLISYIIQTKKMYPQLDGKLKYMKEVVQPKISSGHMNIFKTVYKHFITYYKNQNIVDNLNSDLEFLSLQNQKKKNEESDGSYETVDDEDDQDNEDENVIQSSYSNNAVNQEKNNYNIFMNYKGANAQNSIKNGFNISEDDPEQNLVVEQSADACAAAAPPNIDYQQFYFYDEQQQAYVGGAAAPGP